MDILHLPSVGFLVVFLGTLFLVGELLVKARGLFALLGIALMTVYFMHHIDASTGIWVVILYLAGLGLMVVDGKFIGDGTVSIFGTILMIVGLALPAPGLLYKALVSMAFILGAFSSLLLLKVFPRRQLWSKITHKERLTGEAGFNSLNENFRSLIGKQGTTLTQFRPIGTVEIDGEKYSATSENQWLDAGVAVQVTEVDGTRIVVRKIAPNEE